MNEKIIMMSKDERKKIIEEFEKQQKEIEKLYEEIIKNIRIKKKKK